KPSAISPTKPWLPRSLTKEVMFAATLPKNGMFAPPTSSAQTIPNASRVRPRSVNAPTQPFRLLIAFMSDFPFCDRGACLRIGPQIAPEIYSMRKFGTRNAQCAANSRDLGPRHPQLSTSPRPSDSPKLRARLQRKKAALRAAFDLAAKMVRDQRE